MKIISFLITLCYFSETCLSQNDARILNADEMTKTSRRAIGFIKSNDFPSFKNLFPEEISKQDVQLFGFFNFIKPIIEKDGIPGDESIQVRLSKKLSGSDTIYINVIAFMYRNPGDKENPYEKELTFNFLQKYGTGTIASINYAKNPLSSQGISIRINKLDSFIFYSKNINLYRVFYEEGEIKKTLFGKNKGAFALEGDKSTSVASKINGIFEQIFQELKKAKVEKVEEFRTALNRGANTEYIQTEFMFDNLPYGLFVYLPIKSDSNYKNKIVIRQMQGANLGYQYYINVKGNETLVEFLKSIIKINWGNYYSQEL